MHSVLAERGGIGVRVGSLCFGGSGEIELPLRVLCFFGYHLQILEIY